MCSFSGGLVMYKFWCYFTSCFDIPLTIYHMAHVPSLDNGLKMNKA